MTTRKSAAIDLSQDASRIYSDQQYLDKNPDWHLEDTAWKASEIESILTSNNVKWQTAIEVGCGSGGIVAHLGEKFPDRQLSGIDLADDASEFWSQHSAGNTSFTSGDFLQQKDRYDLLMLIDVFEHVEDYMGFLRKLSSRAENFVFHIPLDLHVQGLLRKSYMNGRDSVGHLHYFSRDSAIATLRDSGYDIVDWRYTDVAGEANASTRPLRTKLLNPIRTLASTIAPNLTATLLGGFSLSVLCVPSKQKTTQIDN